MSLPPRACRRYRELLPVTDATPIISLGEGGTPLVPLERSASHSGCGFSPNSRA